MTITLTREEAQQVLDALNSCDETWVYDGEFEQVVDQYDHKLVAKALETLRARLAQPEPEPWAGVDFDIKTAPPQRVYCSCGDGIVADDGALCGTCVSLKKMREWQGLTDEEKSEIYNRNYNLYAHDMHIGDFFLIQQAVEAKLKEKNA